MKHEKLIDEILPEKKECFYTPPTINDMHAHNAYCEKFITNRAIDNCRQSLLQAIKEGKLCVPIEKKKPVNWHYC